MERGYHHSTRSDQYIAATVASNGTATGFLGPVPEGFCWYVERLTAHSNTANSTTGKLEVYVQPFQAAPNDASKRGRQDFAIGTAVQDSASDENSPIYVGPGDYLVAVWSALTSGDLVSLSAQIRVHKIEIAAHREANGHHPHYLDQVPQQSALDAVPVVPGDTVAAV